MPKNTKCDDGGKTTKLYDRVDALLEAMEEWYYFRSKPTADPFCVRVANRRLRRTMIAALVERG